VIGEPPLRRPAVVFPGQGSQAACMGAAWSRHPAWSIVEEAQEIARRALAPMLLSADHPPASTTDAQLSVVLCSMLSWSVLAPAFDTGGAALLAGHSLGLVSALHAAGALSVADTVRAVLLRAELTEAACDGTAGMTALLLSAEGAHEACRDVADCWVANDNAPSQTVIAGTHEGLRSAAAAARRLGAVDIIPLEVAGAFHTPLMHRASARFAAALHQIPFHPPGAVIVHNGRAHPPGRSDPDTWRGTVADDLTTPVRWRETQYALDRLGADAIVQAGYGRTLTGLAKRTVGHLRLHNAATPAACEDIATLIQAGAAAPADGGMSAGH
jgi:[acyl-carrier-protein] S-malonyltransferase